MLKIEYRKIAFVVLAFVAVTLNARNGEMTPQDNATLADMGPEQTNRQNR